MKPYTVEFKTIETNRGLAIRIKAVIKPCIKRGIRIRRQKTIRLRTVAPEFTKNEMSLAIERELDRWAEKKLSSALNGGMKGVL